MQRNDNSKKQKQNLIRKNLDTNDLLIQNALLVTWPCRRLIGYVPPPGRICALSASFQA
jgi:hypothetical protein